MAVRIEKPQTEPKKKKNPILPLLLVIIVLAAAGAAWFFLTSEATEPSQPFEISNFIGKPEFFSGIRKTWAPASRGEKFSTQDKLRTAKDEEVDLKIPDFITMRLKGNAVLESIRAKKTEKKVKIRLYLDKGSLFGATDKKFSANASMEVLTPDSIVDITGGLFEIKVDPKTGQTWVGVLDGISEVRKKSFLPAEVSKLGSLQSFTPNLETAAKKVSREEWDHLKEAYELIQKGAAHEAEQLDMAKKAGSLYAKVFDHGTFFTPKMGNAERDFFIDEKSGETFLNIAYDVFPRGSYVGMYMKTRNLDLVNFKNLEFEARIAPDQPGPAEFQVEVKSGGAVIRRLSAKQFSKDWKVFSFPLQATKTAPVQEINFYFSHEKVGENSKGAIELRKINLLADPNPPKQAPAEPALVQAKPGMKPRPDLIVAGPKPISTKRTVNTSTSTVKSEAKAPASSAPSKPVPNATSLPDDF